MEKTTRSALFAKGASAAMVSAGIDASEADRVSLLMSKYAADDESLWDRAKGWVIPTLVGISAFIAGDHFGKNGRRDRNALQNLVEVLSRRVRSGTNTRYDSPTRAFSTSNLPTSDPSAVGTELK